MPAATTVIRQPCEDCGGQGYHDDGTSCDDCAGKGVRIVLLVPCPVHRQTVPRDPRGGLLGQCDGCAGEAARAIQFLSTHTTGVDGSSQQRSAADARQGAL